MHITSVCARACNVHPCALQTLILVDVREFAGFGSYGGSYGRLCKNEVQWGTERVTGKGDKGAREGVVVVSFGDRNGVLRSR